MRVIKPLVLLVQRLGLQSLRCRLLWFSDYVARRVVLCTFIYPVEAVSPPSEVLYRECRNSALDSFPSDILTLYKVLLVEVAGIEPASAAPTNTRSYNYKNCTFIYRPLFHRPYLRVFSGLRNILHIIDLLHQMC